MEKLIIAGRINWETKFYMKVKATESALKILREIAIELGGDFFRNNQPIPRSLSPYRRWKDKWIPVSTKKIELEIICGDEYIHLIFSRFPNFGFINKVLNKY